MVCGRGASGHRLIANPLAALNSRLPRWAALPIAIGLLFPIGAWAQLPTPIDVPGGLPAQERQELGQRRSRLIEQRHALEAEIARHDGLCRRVPASDTALVNRCRQGRDRLRQEYEAYVTAAGEYGADAQLAVAEERFKNARSGWASSLLALRNQAFALGLTELRDHLEVLYGGVVALVAKPGPTLGAAAISAIALVETFRAKYPDCGFSDPDLKTSCENAHRFDAIVRSSAEEIRSLCTGGRRPGCARTP